MQPRSDRTTRKRPAKSGRAEESEVLALLQQIHEAQEQRQAAEQRVARLAAQALRVVDALEGDQRLLSMALQAIAPAATRDPSRKSPAASKVLETQGRPDSRIAKAIRRLLEEHGGQYRFDTRAKFEVINQLNSKGLVFDIHDVSATLEKYFARADGKGKQPRRDVWALPAR